MSVQHEFVSNLFPTLWHPRDQGVFCHLHRRLWACFFWVLFSALYHTACVMIFSLPGWLAIYFDLFQYLFILSYQA